MVKIALVADWLPTYGGAEHVLAELHALWPEAPLYTTVANHGRLGPLDAADIRTGYLQSAYRLLQNHRVLLPWLPRAVESMDLRGYDVVLSSSHAVGKGIIPPSAARHICYCHTPMRYAWEMEAEYLANSNIPTGMHRTIRKMLAGLRRWDLTTAQRVDVFIANSSTTQERVKRIYNRDSVVIHPPVSEHFLSYDPPENGREYFLAIGRLVPYKRFDLLIKAANDLRLPLKIAGTGPESSRLRRLAGPNVEFLGFVPDKDLPALYAGAKALLFPQLEDAGVVPLEAQACGTPVVAYGRGGVRDTVKDGETGLFFAEQTTDSLQKTLEDFARINFDTRVIRQHARQFSAGRFKAKIREVVLHPSHPQSPPPALPTRPPG